MPVVCHFPFAHFPFFPHFLVHSQSNIVMYQHFLELVYKKHYLCEKWLVLTLIYVSIGKVYILYANAILQKTWEKVMVKRREKGRQDRERKEPALLIQVVCIRITRWERVWWYRTKARRKVMCVGGWIHTEVTTSSLRVCGFLYFAPSLFGYISFGSGFTLVSWQKETFSSFFYSFSIRKSSGSS